MNDGLKQRMVGAIVLIVLAVIFLPMAFDFRGERKIDRTSRIPERPTIAPVEISAAIRPEGVIYPKSGDKAYQLDKSRADVQRQAQRPESNPLAETASKPKPESKPEPPSLNDKGIPVGWVVQVGSFKEQQKAVNLEKELIADGYKAYLRHSRSQAYYRVYVGPQIDKSDALNSQKRIDEKYRVKSLLLKFEL